MSKKMEPRRQYAFSGIMMIFGFIAILSFIGGKEDIFFQKNDFIATTNSYINSTKITTPKECELNIECIWDGKIGKCFCNKE